MSFVYNIKNNSKFRQHTLQHYKNCKNAQNYLSNSIKGLYVYYFPSDLSIKARKKKNHNFNF